MGHDFAHYTFNQAAAAFDLSHEHCALNHRQTIISELIRIYLRIQSASGLFFDEEGGKLCPGDFKNQAEILPDQLIVLRHFVADRAERASTRHAVALL